MKNEKIPVCPGCKRHCPLSNVRCKYGRNYIEKMMTEDKKRHDHKHGHKWDKFVSEGSMLCSLLITARAVKHSLRDKTADEAKLTYGITEEEMSVFTAVLKKIEENIPQYVSNEGK